MRERGQEHDLQQTEIVRLRPIVGIDIVTQRPGHYLLLSFGFDISHFKIITILRAI